MRAVAVFAVLIVTVVAVGVVNARVVSGQAESACVTGGAVASGNTGLVSDCEILLGMRGHPTRQRVPQLVGFSADNAVDGSKTCG